MLLLQHQSLYYNLRFTCACFLCRHAHTSVKTPSRTAGAGLQVGTKQLMYAD